MTKNNLGRRFPLSGSGEALFRQSFFPDEIGAELGSSLSSTFYLKHLLMPWTVVAIARGRPPPRSRAKIRIPHHPTPPGLRPPPPPRGAGAVMAIPNGKPCPGLQSIGNTRMGSQQRYDQLFRRALPATGYDGDKTITGRCSRQRSPRGLPGRRRRPLCTLHTRPRGSSAGGRRSGGRDAPRSRHRHRPAPV